MPEILFILTQRIGDVLATTPVMSRVAEQYGPVTVVCKPSLAELLQHNPDVKNIITFTTPMVRLAAALQFQKKYQLAFCYTENTSFIRYATAIASQVIGFEPSSRKNHVTGVLYRKRPHSNNVHLVTESALLISGFTRGIERQDRLVLNLTHQERLTAKQTLQSIRSAATFIAVKMQSHPDRSYRDWPVDSFVELFKRLSAQHKNLVFLLLGPPEESNFLRQVSLRSEGLMVLPLITQTIREAAAVIAEADIYIGIDTGLTHIASCFDKPIIALYHASITAERAGPFNHPYSFCINMPPNESSFERNEGDMISITVDAVENRVLKAIELT